MYGAYFGALGGAPAVIILIVGFLLTECLRVGATVWLSVWTGGSSIIIILKTVLLTFINNFMWRFLVAPFLFVWTCNIIVYIYTSFSLTGGVNRWGPFPEHLVGIMHVQIHSPTGPPLYEMYHTCQCNMKIYLPAAAATGAVAVCTVQHFVSFKANYLSPNCCRRICR